VLAVEMIAPVLVEVAVGDDGAEGEDGFASAPERRVPFQVGRAGLGGDLSGGSVAVAGPPRPVPPPPCA
jgi:hypothetical protein